MFGFKVDRALVVKTGVKSGAVIEGFDVIEDRSTSLGEAVEAMMVDELVFEAAKKRLNKGIVVTVASPAHRSG